MNSDFYGQSKSAEQYTPRFWWELVIKVMGAIDFDPSADPNHGIPATVHYTRQENGLRQPWNGRGYNNPPFGKDLIKWFEKADKEMREGRCTELIILWKAALETKATRVIIGIPAYKLSAVPNSRISFNCGDDSQPKRGGGDSSTFTPIFHYLGPNEQRFIDVFGKHCTLWKPLNRETPDMNLGKFFHSREPDEQ
jgi:hypothetical protein